MAEKFDVTLDRDKYIGGSDVPAIMGLSSFKSRWECLQEKAGLWKSDFEGNEYTEYGHKMEINIRDRVNFLFDTKFDEDIRIDGIFRYHADGYCPITKRVLEVKTTSQIHDDVRNYKAYLVQLIKGMIMFGSDTGMLAVYERPEDMSLDFDADRLQIYTVNKADYLDLFKEVEDALDRFVKDLERLRADNTLTEVDFIPKDVLATAMAIEAIEKELATLDDRKKELQELKEKLASDMQKEGVKKFAIASGTKISFTPPSTTTKMVIDEGKLKSENEELYNKCLVEKTTNKKGYITVTLK